MSSIFYITCLIVYLFIVAFMLGIVIREFFL
jgi:hypothetical protein